MFGRSRAANFCWPSNLAIITDGVAYVNQELETQGTEVVGDILWRALKGRGGRRGIPRSKLTSEKVCERAFIRTLTLGLHKTVVSTRLLGESE